MVLRSDESANEAEIQRNQKLGSNIKKGVVSAASLGGIAAGGPLASKIMPFLSKYVPVDLAIKGISKINPKIGEFLKKGQSMGLNVEEGFDFVKEKLGGDKQNTRAEEKRNIIQQYSPELHSFISEEVKKGRSPIEAGALAQVHDKFKKVIKKLTDDHKTDFQSILSTIYGEAQSAQPSNVQEPQNPQTQQQPGSGQQALMSILQKIQQQRGAR